MSDPRVRNLARILVQYSTRVQPKDRVMIRGFPLQAVAEPLIKEVVREVLRAGGYPHLRMTPKGYQSLFLREANDEQLAYIDPLTRLTAEEFEVDIRISSFTNTHAVSGQYTEKLRKIQQANTHLGQTWMERAARGEFRWVATRYPTNANAQNAEMSMPEYLDFFYKSCYADQEDPIKAWLQIQREGERIAHHLKGKNEFHFKGPDINLKMSLTDRTFIIDAGENNMPDGEIHSGPVEDSVEGWVRFSYPCIRLGTEVEGVELIFDRGKVVKASATKNEKYLLEQLDVDPGARYVGEIGLGINQAIQRFTKNMLFDEKLAGTIHLALGAGYPKTGSKNKSMIHWDMLVDMRSDSEIIADGEVIYHNGRFR